MTSSSRGTRHFNALYRAPSDVLRISTHDGALFPALLPALVEANRRKSVSPSRTRTLNPLIIDGCAANDPFVYNVALRIAELPMVARAHWQCWDQ